jgi:hypothetical protein
LETFFAGKEKFNKFHLLEMLMDGKYVDTGKPVVDVQKFLSDKSELVRRLKTIGMTVPEDFLICIILARLPDSFDAMRRVFESQADPTLQSLGIELNKEAVRKRKRDESALFGKDDVIPQKPPKKPRLAATDKKKVVCNYCKSKGHEAQQCWLNPDSPNYRPELVEKLARAAAAAANARQQQNAPQE